MFLKVTLFGVCLFVCFLCWCFLLGLWWFCCCLFCLGFFVSVLLSFVVCLFVFLELVLIIPKTFDLVNKGIQFGWLEASYENQGETRRKIRVKCGSD